MKTKLLFFLLLLLFIPVVSPAAVTHTLEIEFSFAPSDDPAKHIIGYNVYKESEQVTCENESNPDASIITCNFYSADGTFNFTLAALYSDGTESPSSPPFQFTINTTTVTPPDPDPDPDPEPEPDPPHAVINPTTTSGTTPLRINFSGAGSTENTLTYSWDFGDGDSGSGPNISHTYHSEGNYTAKLTVTNEHGSDTASAAITVTEAIVPPPPNQQPIAVISAEPVQCEVPLSVFLDGSHSSDPDGSITRYDWNFGDGSAGAGPTVQHAYAESATYTVSLTVTDNKGAIGSKRVTVSGTGPCGDKQTLRTNSPFLLQTVYNLLLLK